MLIEFGSVVGAVQCAIGLQKLAAERNTGLPDESRLGNRYFCFVDRQKEAWT